MRRKGQEERTEKSSWLLRAMRDFIPQTFCVYRLEQEVEGWHKGTILATRLGPLCSTKSKLLLERLRLSRGDLVDTGTLHLFQPMRHLWGEVWIGRDTGAVVPLRKAVE